LLIVLAAFALLKPRFFKNKVNTALASSFSAANRVGDNSFTFNDSSVSEYKAQMEGLMLIRIVHY